jgi:hypothetical protein
MGASETSIKDSIQSYLHSVGAWEVKIWGNQYMRKGIPDILCCYKGRFIALEIKRPGEVPDKLQKYELEQIRKAGGITEVVFSKNDVKEIMGGIK